MKLNTSSIRGKSKNNSAVRLDLIGGDNKIPRILVKVLIAREISKWYLWSLQE